MSNLTKLYQKSSTGKTKFLEFSTDGGGTFITTWGLLDGKTQTTKKDCVGMNVGKANETSPAQQAILEMEAKIVKKMKEGYVKEFNETFKEDINVSELDLDNLPKQLCPSKPISKMPDSLLTNPNTYGSRKHNGHCLILVKGKTTEKIYTRRMENITQYVKDVPVIKEAMLKVPAESFVLHECVYYSKTYRKEMPRFVAQVITKEDAVQCVDRYNNLSLTGTFSMVPFDALFLRGKFLGDTDYISRHQSLVALNMSVPLLYPNWMSMLTQAKRENWEGFIVRLPGDKSHICYTMDGKPKRTGAWKYKFVSEDDFYIDEVLKGDSGKHANFYAKFHVGQYDTAGNKIDRGYVGPGTLTHEDLEQLTKDLDSGAKALPLVAEIEYQDLHSESGKIEFGIIKRIRADKTAQECLNEE